MLRKSVLSIFALSIAATNVNARITPHLQQILIAPNCLVEQLEKPYKTLSANANFSLFAIDFDALNDISTVKNTKPCGHFKNVTQDWNDFNKHHAMTSANAKLFLENNLMPHKIIHASPYQIQYPKQVAELFNQLNPQAMWDNLTTLSNYKDRYANSDNGLQAAKWLQAQIETLAKDNHRDDVTVYTITTGTDYKQPSVIAKIGTSSEPGIVISAHMDTLSSTGSKKPGADDDGSGSVTVLETARTILSSNMRFKKPIYFIWYAAEEEGLVGSQAVVAEFKKNNIPVDAVLHFDLTGYAYKNSPAMWLITDNVNADLTNYLETLINTYVKQTVKRTECGYACSDHATWTENGYAAAIPAETAYENTNPVIHTS
ncbi:MAG: M20/M25/M40 family metallo-hydrolase, partial [Gammaproteobacteria bacterium]|nr:M20/M25/M40 family metallo-hydrolase [Gammaproteobacteria bacterium]